MKSHKVKLHLFLTILILTLVPLGASFLFLNETLETALRLGFNREVPALIESSEQSLKRLKEIDPANEALYRERFERAESLKHIYEDRDLLVSSIDGSLKVYFALGLVLALAVSLGAALWLSRRIALSYSKVIDEMIKTRERAQALEELSTWQETARYLAHEIKNPLTPIEMSIANLERAHAVRSRDEFGEQLIETRRMIGDELAHLKLLVGQFSEFARTPAPRLEPLSLHAFLKNYVSTHGAAWDTVHFDLKTDPGGQTAWLNADPALLRQVMNNLVLNAIEANPEPGLTITLSLEAAEAVSVESAVARAVGVQLRIANSGAAIPSAVAQKVFQPNFSTKAKSTNSGIGLAIVRKIVLEHGGEIAYDEHQGRPSFVISLPMTNEKSGRLHVANSEP